jgi:hypothetical protein
LFDLSKKSLGAVAIKQNIKARRGYPVDLCRKACPQAATSANPKKKVGGFSRNKRIWQAQGCATDTVDRQSGFRNTVDQFFVVLHHELLKPCGFARMFYVFLSVHPPHD